MSFVDAPIISLALANQPTHFAVVRPDDEGLPRGAPRDDAGEVERGALAQEHLARTQDRRLGGCNKQSHVRG